MVSSNTASVSLRSFEVIVIYSVPNTTKTVVLTFWMALQSCTRSVPELKSGPGKWQTGRGGGGGGVCVCVCVWKQSSRCNKYEMRPAVRKLYQLSPKVSASRVSVAYRVVNPKHDELRPAVGKELYQLHRKLWVYKMSNNWKILTQFYCTLLYTQLYANVQNCWIISTTQLLYHVTV
jgi:hypothetical protein